MQLKPINQQVVVVVGASSGIGRDTAVKFAHRGAKVVVAARSELGLKSLVDEIHNLGGEAIAVVADVADFQQVKQIADTTVATYGRLDTWVHAAATGVLGLFEDITPEEFKRVIDVTLMGQVYGAMVALPYLKQQGRGALIHISSMEGRRSLPLQSPYSSAKHGLEGFLEALRVELQHEKVPISVTSILPSVINTPYYNKVRTKLGVKPTGIPPYYDASVVTDAILYAAEHPVRNLIPGDVGKLVDILQRVSPELADAILVLVGFAGQRTNQPKAAGEDSLFTPVDDYDRVKGDFDRLVIPTFLDGFERIPGLKLGAAVVAAAGLVAFLSGWSWEK